MADEWKKKFKGSPEWGGAYIYTHPKLDRAIVSNHYGVMFDGVRFASVEEAKQAAINRIAAVSEPRHDR